MSTLQIIFYYLDKELPKELILKILFKSGGLEHPLIKHIKHQTSIHKYSNKYNQIKRPFGKLCYNFKDITERQRRILGLKDNYGDSIWTLNNCNLNRSSNVLENKLKCCKCDFPYWTVSINSYYKLKDFDMSINKQYINHIYYVSYTKFVLLLEKYLGMDFNKKFICKDCENVDLKNIQIVHNKLNITYNLIAEYFPTYYRF